MAAAHSSSSSSSGEVQVVPRSGLDSCTFEGPKYGSYEGCYTYRSCRSCLAMDGCFVNEHGICADVNYGVNSIDSSQPGSSSYEQWKNYRGAFSLGLVLPHAANTEGNDMQQTWHFLASETKYCKASDPVCQECKKQNFWRTDTDPSALPDSRFCVGQDDCVCIQTCEVPAFRPPGCQWQLTTSRNYYDNGYYRSSYQVVVSMAWWEWMLLVILIIFVPPIIRSTRSGARRERECKEIHRLVRFEISQTLDDTPTTGQQSVQ